MVLKRCKAGFNTGNSFGRRRINYLKRKAAASWAYVTTGARVSSLKHVQSIDALMLDLSLWHDMAISVTEAGHLKAAHSTKLGDGTTTLESVAYSLNKKKRWQSVYKFEQGINSDVAQLASERDDEKQCALSFMVCERAYLDSSNRSASTTAKLRCVACSNLNVQPYKKPRVRSPRKFMWKCRKCPKCDTLIEKDGGCRRMYCPACFFSFCWVCMNPIHSKDLCIPVSSKPVVFTDVRPRKLITCAYDELTVRNVGNGYPSFTSDNKKAESKLNRRAIPSRTRRVKVKCHHNQHFRGVQRPEKVKREVQVYKESGNAKNALVDRAEDDFEAAAVGVSQPQTQRRSVEQECDSQQPMPSKTDKDNERQVTPHLFYTVDKAKALSSFVYSKLLRKQPKTGKRQRKRNVEVDCEDARTLALSVRDSACEFAYDYDYDYDWQQEVGEDEQSTDDECKDSYSQAQIELDLELDYARDSVGVVEVQKDNQQLLHSESENQNDTSSVTRTESKRESNCCYNCKCDSLRVEAKQATPGQGKKVYSLVDFVRAPRKNTHAGRARKGVPTPSKGFSVQLQALLESQSSVTRSVSDCSIVKLSKAEKEQESGRSSPLEDSWVIC